MADKISFGIDGLDKALEGGLPKGNLTLISGGAGTGKSTLCLQYLVNGAMKFGEKGLYISTEQTEEELRKQAASFGWDLAALEKRGLLKLKFLDFVKGENALTAIYNTYSSFSPARMVIDSLTSLTDSIFISGIGEETAFSMVQVAETISPIPRTEKIIAKSILYQLLAKLRLFGATTLLTSELPEKAEFLSSDKVSEFITDGVITMHYLGLEGAETRTLRIRKMRYTNHNKSHMAYDMVTGKGLVVKV